jgi:Domain of unknown function (DUF4082)
MNRLRKIIPQIVLLLLLINSVSIAQYRQYNPPADVKQTVKQKPWYGPDESIITNFWEKNPPLSFSKETITDIPYELGYVFQSSKKGQVTQLVVRMPRDGVEAGPEMIYTVSLWDYDTQQLLAQTNITTTDIRFTYKNLDNAIPIVSNKKYVVSVFIKPVNLPAQTSWSFYSMIKPGGNNTAIPFIPFTSGSLTVLNTQSTLSNTPAFPSTVGYHKDIITGLCDVVFKATEK